MVAIPAGRIRPLYAGSAEAPRRVGAFRLDRDQVTRGEFLAFVRANPEWRRSRVAASRADRASYLADWRADLDATRAGGSALDLDRPATGVSWHAARAYCAAEGKRLPTTLEWEYAAAASRTRRDAANDPAFIQQVVGMYSARRAPLRPVEQGTRNAFGVRGMHDLAWEWVADGHRSAAHGAGGGDASCAGASVGAIDPGNYPAFLRHALRAGLTDRSSMETLGFRCAA